MIISHKYKFIFIKTVKTAGTSLEVFLSQHCGDQDILTPIIPHVEPHVARNYQGKWNPIPELLMQKGKDVKVTLTQLYHSEKFYNHIPANLVRARISPKIWNSYFKFCVERNPWDKTLSHYHMHNYRSGGNMSLEDYFQRNMFCLNYPKYMDDKGNLLVDRVLKFETLSQDLAEIFSDLGIPFNGSLGVKAKSEYRADRAPYQEVFSSEQQKTLEQVFAKEIAMHEYVF